MKMENKNIVFCIFLCLLFTSCSYNKFDSVKFFINSKETSKAEMVLNSMSVKQKNTFEYNYLHGLIYIQKSVAGYKRDALNSFLNANEIKSDDYYNNLMISKMYIEVNELKLAETYGMKAWELRESVNLTNTADDAAFILAHLCMTGKNYEQAAGWISKCLFNNDPQVIFLKTEINDLKENKSDLEKLYLQYNREGMLNESMQIDFMNYLFIRKNFSLADKTATDFISCDDEYLNYYGYLFKAFISMMNRDYGGAQKSLDDSLEFSPEDSMFFRYKIKAFYAYMTEKDPVKINNSFLIYKFFYEKSDTAQESAGEDLDEFNQYFKDDVYFNLLKAKY